MVTTVTRLKTAFILAFAVGGLSHADAATATATATDDRAIWKALKGVLVEPLPSTPDFAIAERKDVGRLRCSHLQQFGHPESFQCFLRVHQPAVGGAQANPQPPNVPSSGLPTTGPGDGPGAVTSGGAQ